MERISIRNNQANQVLSDFQYFFGPKAKIEGNCLAFQSDKGAGEIEHLSLKDGIGLYRINMLLNEAITLDFEAQNNSTLNFCYCSDGIVSQSFDQTSTTEQIEKFKTSIVGHPAGSSCSYELEENQRINLVLINVSMNVSPEMESCEVKKQIHKLFLPYHKNDYLFYQGSFNLKIADKIRQLENMEETGVVRCLMTEGLIKYILALEVKQHGEDMSHAVNDLGSLRVSEMEMIKDITAFIDDNIHMKLNLDFLRNKTGLSPKKLQEGFKLMHGKTVNDYIKKIRLQVAEHLIKTSDLNISEVVYTIGLSSRSYFSRIFLEHYKICPKDYKDRHGITASA